MTKRGDKLQRVNKLVVAIDICSSSKILEGLISSDNLQPLADATVELKEFISVMARERNALVYKFTGDGFIVLFQEPYDGKEIAEFIAGAGAIYQHCYDTEIKPVLHQAPSTRGLKFGIDDGVLLKLRMDERDEYIGRPINIACRLQGLVTNADMNDGCQALISSRSYAKIGHALGDFSPVETRRSLRNIAGEEGFLCYKLAISEKSCQASSELIGQKLAKYHSAPGRKPVGKDVRQDRLLSYLDAVEGVNRQLLNTLKRCLELLAQFNLGTPDEKEWKALLEDIENIIRAGEEVSTERTVH